MGSDKPVWDPDDPARPLEEGCDLSEIPGYPGHSWDEKAEAQLEQETAGIESDEELLAKAALVLGREADFFKGKVTEDPDGCWAYKDRRGAAIQIAPKGAQGGRTVASAILEARFGMRRGNARHACGRGWCIRPSHTAEAVVIRHKQPKEKRLSNYMAFCKAEAERLWG